MLVKLNNPSLFAKAIELMSELIIEVKIKLTDFGLTITAIDPASIAMVDLKIPKSAFSVYEPENQILCVNLEDLKKILKRCSAKSSLTLEKKENTLTIKIDDRIKRSFSLNLIEIDSEEKDFPTLEYSSRVELDSQDFVDSIEDCAVVSDACSFVISEGKFIIEAKELNSARSEFSSDEAKISAENCKARYSLEYLQKFIKGSKLFPKTILNFATEHPLKMDLLSENLIINFLLAPRMEIED
jgi:proliferating cell nuclear antigen